MEILKDMSFIFLFGADTEQSIKTIVLQISGFCFALKIEYSTRLLEFTATDFQNNLPLNLFNPSL